MMKFSLGLGLMGLFALFQLSLTILTLVLIRSELRPELDKIEVNLHMFDFVEVGHWIIAGLMALGVLVGMGRAVMGRKTR